MARTELDDHLRTTAIKAGATAIDGARAVDVRREGGRVAAVVFTTGTGPSRSSAARLVVADGVRSPLGKVLGREWHRDTVYGVAGRSYVASESPTTRGSARHLELRGEDGEILSGYGWIFPLGTGEVNIGVGTLATRKRPAERRHQAADGSTTPTSAARSSSSPASSGCRPRRCCRWAAPCPTWPAPTGR